MRLYIRTRGYGDIRDRTVRIRSEIIIDFICFIYSAERWSLLLIVSQLHVYRDCLTILHIFFRLFVYHLRFESHAGACKLGR